MAKICGYNKHNILVLVLVVLVFASMIVNSQCRLITTKQIQEEEKEDNEIDGMKWEVEMMSRDEVVRVAGYGEDKLSTVLITGTLLCHNPCLASNNMPLPISGALVGASCDSKRKDNLVKTTTDNYGEFTIDLPSHLHSIPSLEKVCSITILEVPNDTLCHQSNIHGKYKEIELASIGNGIRTYTTGRIEFHQTKANNSEACIIK